MPSKGPETADTNINGNPLNVISCPGKRIEIKDKPKYNAIFSARNVILKTGLLSTNFILIFAFEFSLENYSTYINLRKYFDCARTFKVKVCAR